MRLKRFNSMNEAIEPQEFFVGEKVLVNGHIDDRSFDNHKGIVINICPKSTGETDMSEKGQCRTYIYRGTTYLIRFDDIDDSYGGDYGYNLEWWCPPWNMTKIEKNEIKEEDIEWF